MAEPMALPLARICIGVTGHRATNGAFAENEPRIRDAVAAVFDAVDAAVASLNGAMDRPRLHSLLASGADALAVKQARARCWEIRAPLPFGRDLNVAINAHPETVEDAQALMTGGQARQEAVAGQAAQLRQITAEARLFELADQDEQVAKLFLDRLRTPGDPRARAHYAALASERAAVAGRVMIEQSDLLIAIWDGVSPGSVGGTRHTIAAALDHGLAVVWIDARAPVRTVVLQGPESLDHPPAAAAPDEVDRLIERLIDPADAEETARAIRFHTEQWHTRSSRRFHAYRRIEALFGTGTPSRLGSLRQRYERPGEIARGSGANLIARARALPGVDQDFVAALESRILGRFAWADGLSTYLSDAYRGGMVTNFLLSAFAIVVGIAYLPFASVDLKWPFALAELLLLLGIVVITTVGRRRRWHGRWFETRRVAEYLRHAPMLLMMGVSRAGSRWPRGLSTAWPERYARNVQREIGLPELVVTPAYLRTALGSLLGQYVAVQRDYHRAKAMRLAAVHHNLDRISEILFLLAIVSVASYLLLVAATAIGAAPASLVDGLSKPFTFLGVLMPAIGGAFAGIRYFGDFERFSAISEVTAERLEGISARIATILAGDSEAICYMKAASLAHAMDDVVVAEIEAWQSVFAAKNIAVPV
jgi:hypothetical protein